MQEMHDFGVTDLVRTCESTYDGSVVQSAGIRVHDMVFPDGEPPSSYIIDYWLVRFR